MHLIARQTTRMLALVTILFCAVGPVHAERSTVNFNRNWRFWLGDVKQGGEASGPQALATWTFDRGLEGWGEPQQCSRFEAVEGTLTAEYEGKNPQFNSPPIAIEGPLDVVFQLRSRTGGDLTVLWATPEQGYSASQTSTVPIRAGEGWQEVTLSLGTAAKITRFRLDPPGRSGTLEIEEVALLPMTDPSAPGQRISSPGFNDSHWQAVRLPHDWAISGPFDPNGDGHTGKLPWRGQGWYRKTFTLDATEAACRFYLDFDGVMAQPRVYINGQFAGAWDYGYNSFRIDVTPFVRTGAKNVVAVHADTRRHNSRWYPGAGIYRQVRLVQTAPVHIAHWGVTVSTPDVNDQRAQVRVQTEIDNHLNQEQILTLTAVVQDPNARPVAHTRMSGVVGPGLPSSFVQELTVALPYRWDVDNPHLYTVVTAVMHNGVLLDRIETPFGIRTFQFTPDNGFFLNGRRLPLRGVNLHHDQGPLGAAILPRAVARQLEIMKVMGCNAIRTSHNIPAPEILDLCDQLGLLVYNEVFDKWHGTADRVHGEPLLEYGHKQIRNVCRRDRNHPSVVVWSIGNEIPYVLGNQSGNAPAEVASMASFFRMYDPTRPVTMACHMTQGLQGGILDSLDIQSWNYGRKYVQAREQYPDQPSICAESASALSTRGFYELPHPQSKAIFSNARQVDSYDWNAAAWADIPDVDFAGLARHRFCAGEFVWTGFDYLGEPTPFNRAMVSEGRITQAQMARSSYFGIVDLCGIPKDRYYLYRSVWAPEHLTVHILPHWNWAGREGKAVPVYVYTNGDSAELFLNGRSQGRRHKQPMLPPPEAGYYDVMDTYRLRWEDVLYEPGELKVVAYRGDAVIGEAFKRTAEKETALRLVSDRRILRADGDDLAYILVGAMDNQGTLCPLARNRVTFTVTGEGTIAGVGNGNPLSLEPFAAAERSLFYGKAMLILRTTETPGSIKVTAQAEGLQPASVTLSSR